MAKYLGAEPFLMKPAAKDYLWGGSRLNDDFAKGIDMEPLAETWECSTHPDGVSQAASGRFDGMLLTDVLRMHPEYIGTHPNAGTHFGSGTHPNGATNTGSGIYPGSKVHPGSGTHPNGEMYSHNGMCTNNGPELPIIIKFIDARRDLSVQVHPCDEYAYACENGQSGKTEMWYVLDAAKDAALVYGFAVDVNKKIIRKSIEKGTIEKYLQKVPVKKDDVFYIEAGTVHAIGAGVLIAEIQENSNLTYRMYDYDRVDRQGNKRPLHIEKALEVANFKSSAKPRQPMRVLKFRNGYATELLCRCAYFQVERMLLNTETCRNMASFQTDSTSFQVFLCVDGCGVMYWNDSMLNFYKGDCIFIPADSVVFKIHGKAQILCVKC